MAKLRYDYGHSFAVLKLHNEIQETYRLVASGTFKLIDSVLNVAGVQIFQGKPGNANQDQALSHCPTERFRIAVTTPKSGLRAATQERGQSRQLVLHWLSINGNDLTTDSAVEVDH